MSDQQHSAVLDEAQAEQAKAEAKKANAEARKMLAEAKEAEIKLRKAERDEAATLALDSHHHVYRFNQAVGEKTVADCVHLLTRWDRQDPTCDIEIIFDSPGGSVVDGMHLFDWIQILGRKGHTVTVGTLGMAASMAGILLQAGEHRWMGAEAYILIHQIQAGMMGSWGEIQDRVKWLEKVQVRILDIFVKRCKQAGESGTAGKPATRNLIEKNWTRTDWWIDSAEALRLGLVDEVK